LGGTPGLAPTDPTETLALVGLGTLAGVLAGALGWTVRRLVRAVRRRPGRPAVLAAVCWGGLGILSALAAGLWLPGAFDLQLRHIVRFMPDIGQLAVAIVVLGPTLALARLATLIVESRRR
jgi:hypothetical protein